MRFRAEPTPEFHEKLKEARAAAATRLFALAYDYGSPLQWHHRPDEAAMKAFLDSREYSESFLFNCAVAVCVVNPQDSDETVLAVLAARNPRVASGPGYFTEAF